MKIKFMGLEITTKSSRVEQSAEPKTTESKSMEVEVYRYPPGAPKLNSNPQPSNSLQKILRGTVHPIVAAVKWPVLPVDCDPLTESLHRVAIYEFNDFLCRCRAFNICSVSELVKLLNLSLDYEAQCAYDVLQKIHCKNFSLLNDEVYQSIPALMNLVFRENDRNTFKTTSDGFGTFTVTPTN